MVTFIPPATPCCLIPLTVSGDSPVVRRRPLNRTVYLLSLRLGIEEKFTYESSATRSTVPSGNKAAVSLGGHSVPSPTAAETGVQSPRFKGGQLSSTTTILSETSILIPPAPFCPPPALADPAWEANGPAFLLLPDGRSSSPVKNEMATCSN